MKSVERILAGVLLLSVVTLAKAASTVAPKLSLNDADEVRIGHLLAARFAKVEGLQPLLTMYVILGQQMTHTASEAEKNLRDRIAQLQRLIESEKLATPTENPLAVP